VIFFLACIQQLTVAMVLWQDEVRRDLHEVLRILREGSCHGAAARHQGSMTLSAMASSAASIPSGCTAVADSEDLNKERGLKEKISDPIVRGPDIAEINVPIQEQIKASEPVLHWKEAAYMPCHGEQVAVAERADSFAENPDDVIAEEAKAVTVAEELAAVQSEGVRPIARLREPGDSLSVKPSKRVPRESSTGNVLLFRATMPEHMQLSPMNGSTASAEVVLMDSSPKLLDQGNQQRGSFSGAARQQLGNWKLERQVSLRGTTAAGVNEISQAHGMLQAATGTVADAAPAGSSAAAETAR
jgi:hypothetical protein